MSLLLILSVSAASVPDQQENKKSFTDNHPYLTAALVVVGTIVSAYFLHKLFSSTSLSSGANHVTEHSPKINDTVNAVAQNAGKSAKELLAAKRQEYDAAYTAAKRSAQAMSRS